MATGGSGDVLTGMIVGLMAQNFSSLFEAARLAVYLHGLAGDITAERLGEASVTATSILDAIPFALQTESQGDTFSVQTSHQPGSGEESTTNNELFCGGHFYRCPIRTSLMRPLT
jgi:hypothetical protein